MKSIGGYFDLELGTGTGSKYHNTIAMHAGRACFSFILQTLLPTCAHLSVDERYGTSDIDKGIAEVTKRPQHNAGI